MPEGEPLVTNQADVKPSIEEEKVPFSESELEKIASNAAKFVKEHLPILTKAKIGEFEAELESPYSPRALMDNRSKIPPDIGKRFDAHGISKNGFLSQLKSLVGLLSEGIDNTREFHTAALRLTDEEEIGAASGIGAVGPYENGGFIIIGHPDNTIREKGICAVLVEEHFYSAIPILQQKFPHILFIRADEMVGELPKLLPELKPN